MTKLETLQGISPIEEILEEYRAGRMVILVDDVYRENEGDLIIGAGFVTAAYQLHGGQGEGAHLPDPDRSPLPPSSFAVNGQS